MKSLFLFTSLFVTAFVFSQSLVEISVKGKVRDYSSRANLFGSTLYILQNGTVCGKSVSESNGMYYLSGSVNTSLPFEILSSKPGYATKKVLINLHTVKLKRGKNVSLQIAEELSFSLYQIIENADLSFSKNEYAEKFNWDESQFKIIPEGIEKTMDERAERAYENAKAIKGNNTNRNDSAQIANNDNKIEKQIQDALKKGNDLLDAKNYLLAISEFEKASQLASAHSNSAKITGLINQSKDGLKQSKDKKNQEDQVFNDQLAIAKKKISEGRTGLQKASDVLNSVPMKSRSNDPEVLGLLMQISELNKFYSEYDQALEKLKSDTVAAVKMLNTVYNKGLSNSTFTPASDIAQIKSTLSGLESLKNKNNTANADVNTLSNPGEKTMRNPKEALDDLDKTAKENKEQPQNTIEEAINSVEYENSMNAKLNLARSEEDAKEVNILLVERDILQLQEDSAQILRQYRIDSENKEYQYEKFRQDSTALAINYEQMDKVRNAHNNMDSVNYANKRFIDTLQYNTMDKFNALRNSADMAGLKEDSLGYTRQFDVEKKVDDNTYAIFQRDSTALIRTYEQMDQIAQEKDKMDSISLEQTKYLKRINDDQVEQINKFSNNRDLMDLQEDSFAIQRQYRIEKLDNELAYARFQRDSSALFQTYSQSNIIQSMSNTNDLVAHNQKQFLDSLQAAHVKRMIDFENNSDQSALKEDSMAIERMYEVNSLNRQNETALSQRLTQEKEASEARMNTQRGIAEFKPIVEREPNNLADANGNVYAKGAVHEEVFEIKNDLGYVESVIIRRVVVDNIGYGIVYEMVRNENGSNFYTKNGSIITEYEWATQSSKVPRFN